MKTLLIISILMMFAVQAITDDNVYTLDEIIERAQIVNPNLGVLDQDLLISQSQLENARAKKLPQFEGTVISGGVFTVVRATIFQPIYTFGKISSAERAAEKQVEASTAIMKDGVAGAVEKATVAYYKLQLAYTLNELVLAEVATIETMFAGVEELVEGGSPKVAVADKLNFKILLSNVNKSVVSFNKEVQLSKAVLRTMIGLGDEDDFDIESHSLEPVAFESNSLRFYKEYSLDENPQLTAIDASLEAKKFLVQKAKSEYYPTIFLGGTLRYNQSTFFDDTLIAGAGIGINQVLNFSISADINEAEAEYQKSVNEKDAIQDEIGLDIEKSYLEMIENRTNIANEKFGFDAATVLLRNAKANFELGIGSVKDLINAYSAYFKEAGEYYESVYLYNLSVTQIQRAAGNLGG